MSNFLKDSLLPRSAAAVVAFALIVHVTGLPASAADTQSVTVSGDLRVYDGDTLEVGPLILRLHGIDAPELAQDCARPDGGAWPCGKAASDRLVDLLADAVLTCDALDRDAYGRIVARCATDGVDIGSTLVAEGLAWAFIEYSNDYAELEAATRQTGAGIWQAPTQTAQAYRADRWTRAVAAAPGGCPIKGNISGNERIYHTPWSAYYGRVKVNVDAGEIWFCDEAAAQAAGWRPARSR